MSLAAATFFSQVQKSVLQDWDPIEVRDFPEAQNEYDSNVPGICELLVKGESADVIFSHLKEIEVHMGLSGNALKTRAFAESLVILARDLLR